MSSMDRQLTRLDVTTTIIGLHFSQENPTPSLLPGTTSTIQLDVDPTQAERLVTTNGCISPI
ncbi:hypothetical protein FRC17_003911, partial [Serendipita sp. 399]